MTDRHHHTSSLANKAAGATDERYEKRIGETYWL